MIKQIQLKELFDSLKNRYQNNLESIKGQFFFDYVQILYCRCHKIHQNCDGSYIDSPDWIKNKKATINSINKNNNKSYQYAVTIALNYEKIKKDPQKLTEKKLFINKCNWEEKKFPESEKDDSKKILKKIM